jgi:hypothetical protein
VRDLLLSQKRSSYNYNRKSNFFFDTQVLYSEISQRSKKGELKMKKNFILLLGLAFFFFLAAHTSIDEESKIDEILKRITDKI